MYTMIRQGRRPPPSRHGALALGRISNGEELNQANAHGKSSGDLAQVSVRRDGLRVPSGDYRGLG